MDEILKIKQKIDSFPFSSEEKAKYWDGLVRRMKGKVAESIYLMSTKGNQKRLDEISKNFDIWKYAHVIDDELLRYDFSPDLKIILQRFIVDEIKSLDKKISNEL